MKKTFALLIAIVCVMLVSPYPSHAARAKKNVYYQDTVTNTVWDWATTLNKPPKEKERIKNQRRATRAEKRARRAREAKMRENDKFNAARKKKAEQLRDAQVREKRKKLQEKKKNQKTNEVIGEPYTFTK